jgi:phenylalanyl-tRNA synthetase beta chain
MVGVARDLAAALHVPFSIPVPAHLVAEGVETADIAVEDDARELCARFTGTVIEDVGNVEAPALVRHRLALAGMRPVSPVVDISNYVMLELGQPNHPYDIEHLGGRGLVVRRGRPSETVTTLDGATRHLSPEDCVIADANGAAVGVGGIMGGAAAEISSSTRAILLEMANFEPRAVSATGKRLGLSSEARTRFERGVDPELPPIAIDRFVELLGPGARRGETVDIYPTKTAPVVVKLRAARANLVLGTALSSRDCADLLGPIGFGSVASGPEELDVTVPTWRPDCEREIDLVEEVARLYGYERIARSLPARPGGWGGLTAYQKDRRRVRQVLLGVGASEAWTASFCSPADLQRSGLSVQGVLEVENPLDQSQGLLRPSLLPGLLGALRYNRERQAGALCLFEIGSVFRHPGPTDSGPRALAQVVEREQLGLAAVGDGADATYAVRTWQVLARGLRIEGGSLGQAVPGHQGLGTPDIVNWDALHPSRRAVVSLGSGPIGALGEVAPEVAGRYGLDGRVAVLLVDLELLLKGQRRAWDALSVSRYPAADVDLAFNVADEVATGEVAATISTAAGSLLESLALFDIWRDASLGEGRRSLAFRLRLRSAERTLTDEEVAHVRQRVVASVSAAHGATLRGG